MKIPTARGPVVCTFLFLPDAPRADTECVCARGQVQRKQNVCFPATFVFSYGPLARAKPIGSCPACPTGRTTQQMGVFVTVVEAGSGDSASDTCAAWSDGAGACSSALASKCHTAKAFSVIAIFTNFATLVLVASEIGGSTTVRAGSAPLIPLASQW